MSDSDPKLRAEAVWKASSERPGSVLSDPLYIRLGQTVRGPYSLDDLRELANRGGFSKSHEISLDRKSWTSASTRPELFPQASRPVSLERRKSNAVSVSAGMDNDTDESIEADDQRRSQSSANRSSLRNPLNDDSSHAANNPGNTRPMAGQTVLAVILGPVGFILLLVCTASIVLRLRVGPFVLSDNIALIGMMAVDFLLGLAAVIFGQLSIIRFHKIPGTTTERNLIVIGLSCGYTILILSLLFAVVLLISALA